MIVKKNTTYLNEDESKVDMLECIFDSSNILMSTYIPHKEKLYIVFKRGDVYSYGNVDQETYEEFESSDSQGKFLRNVFAKEKDTYPYSKEYKMFEYEIEEAKKTIKEWKEQKETEK